jgi:hypothetical protein
VAADKGEQDYREGAQPYSQRIPEAERKEIEDNLRASDREEQRSQRAEKRYRRQLFDRRPLRRGT